MFIAGITVAIEAPKERHKGHYAPSERSVQILSTTLLDFVLGSKSSGIAAKA